MNSWWLWIGFHGYTILTVLSLVVLIYKNNSFFILVFLCFYFINKYINKSLKWLIEDPRPMRGVGAGGVVANTAFDDVRYYQGSEKFGMPSGHLQIMFYNISFLYFLYCGTELLLFSFFLACITFYQRWLFKRHSVEQLLMGAFVGSCVGAIAVESGRFLWRTLPRGR